MHKSKVFAAGLTIALSICGSVFSHADDSLPVTFSNSLHGFSISFPSGWAQMPAGKVDSANKAAETQHPGWKRPLVHYGYEVTNSAGLAFPPSVIIRVTETDSAPDPKAVKADFEAGEGLPQGVQRGEVTFDQELGAFLQKNTINIAGVPSTEISVAYFLTKASIIKMFFYAPAATTGGAAVPIPQIIRGVRINEEMKPARPAAASRTGLIVALLAMAALVIVLVRAKPSNSPETAQQKD